MNIVGVFFRAGYFKNTHHMTLDLTFVLAQCILGHDVWFLLPYRVSLTMFISKNHISHNASVTAGDLHAL